MKLTNNQALYLRTLEDIKKLERRNFINTLFQQINSKDIEKINMLRKSLDTLYGKLGYYGYLYVKTIQNRSNVIINEINK